MDDVTIYGAILGGATGLFTLIKYIYGKVMASKAAKELALLESYKSQIEPYKSQIQDLKERISQEAAEYLSREKELKERITQVADEHLLREKELNSKLEIMENRLADHLTKATRKTRAKKIGN